MESGESGAGGEWSVVVTRIDRFWDCHRHAQGVFGREGLDTYSLYQLGGTPAEVSDGLSCEQAQVLAARLNEIGAVAVAARSDSLPEVRWRASQVWPDKCVGGLRFKEIDGPIISGMAPVQAREFVEAVRKEHPEGPVWGFEWDANHHHPGEGVREITHRERLRAEVEAVEGLRSALKHAYPDRRFTIEHWPGELVTFYQTTSDSPRAEYGEPGELPGQVWCSRCHGERGYAMKSTNAAAHELEWGVCNECAEKVLVRAAARRIFIGPGADQLTADS